MDIDSVRIGLCKLVGKLNFQNEIVQTHIIPGLNIGWSAYDESKWDIFFFFFKLMNCRELDRSHPSGSVLMGVRNIVLVAG